jgi:uncharacterized membrane protein YqaE (UPF0057 family)
VPTGASVGAFDAVAEVEAPAGGVEGAGAASAAELFLPFVPPAFFDLAVPASPDVLFAVLLLALLFLAALLFALFVEDEDFFRVDAVVEVFVSVASADAVSAAFVAAVVLERVGFFDEEPFPEVPFAAGVLLPLVFSAPFWSAEAVEEDSAAAERLRVPDPVVDVEDREARR